MVSTSVNYQFNLNLYDDKLLYEMVKYQMMEKGGENDWFEVKRGGIPKKEYRLLKLSNMISSLSNTGGGLIYFGWDEKTNSPNFVQRDDLEGVLLPLINECNPRVPIEFHSINFDDVSGLFVGIPALDVPVMHYKTNKYFYRAGGHSISTLSKETLLKTQPQFFIKESGHIYMKNVEALVNEVLPKYLATQLKSIENYFIKVKPKIIDDILNNWEINFIQWLGDPPYSFPKRVRYYSWLASRINSDSYRLQSDILAMVQTGFELLDKIEKSPRFSIPVETLKELIRDNSKSQRRNPINHRKCLTTLISRNNLWNFADARIFLNQQDDGYYLQQDTSGHDYNKNIAEFNDINLEEIQNFIMNHVKDQYINYVNSIADAIIQQLEDITSQLKVVGD